MIAKVSDFLQNQHPFQLLSGGEIDRVQTAATTCSFAAGTAILEQGGEISPCLFLLAEGSVKLVRDGQEIQILEEGDCFGYPSIIAGASPTFAVVADEAVTAHCVPADLFGDLLRNAAFAEFFLKSLGERLQRLTRRNTAQLGAELTTEVGTLELAPPVTVAPDATVAEAARAMREARVDVVLVTSEPPGILTDHDFQAKVLAEDLGPDTPAVQVMSRPLKTLPDDALVHRALLFMLEQRIHHLPVTEGERIRGVLSATDLLRHHTRNPLYLMRQLDKVDSAGAVAGYARDAAAMVERLFDGGLKVGQIGRICASLGDTLVRRLLHLAEGDVGAPPCPYAWLVFGSEGRMEQALINDQDNALVYRDDAPECAAYFAELTAHVVDNLIAAGYPPCPGGYMATRWCKPLKTWEKTVAEWIRAPDPDNLMVAAIFFDFRAVGGTLSVESIEELIDGAAESQLFLAHLARAAQNWRPPLGLFRRIQAEDGRVDIKTGGLAPLVGLARVYGLKAGSRARPTRERFEAAVEAGVLGRDLGQTAIETYRFLLHLRLQEQLEMLKDGGEAGNQIRLKSLSPLEHRHLKEAFGAIRELQESAGRTFRTQMLG